MRLYSILVLLLIFLVGSLSCGGGGKDKSPVAPTYPAGKPTGVDAVSASQSATLSWNEVAGAVGYYVYISQDGVSFHKYDSNLLKVTSITLTDLTNGVTYYFGVSAVGAGGWESAIGYAGGSPKADPVVPGKAKPPDDPDAGRPYPPENLQGVAKDSACELHWEPSLSGDIHYYRIYRATPETRPFSAWPLVVDYWEELSFRDEDLLNDEEYSYRITVMDTEAPAFESVPSNEVTLVPMDFPPEILTDLKIFVNPGRILVEWSIPIEDDIAKYAIERVEAKDPITGAEIVTRFVIDKPTRTAADPHIYLGGLVVAYVDLERSVVVVQDMAVTVGRTYTYRIAAVDLSAQEGPPATIASELPVF